MNKRAIVLGGAGLIGSHLCVRLLKEGYDVVCIDKRQRRESPLLRNIEEVGRFHFLQHDISANSLEISCDELYNLATPMAYGENFSPIEVQQFAANGANSPLSTLAGTETKVLYGSSGDVYNYERIDAQYASRRQFVADSKRFAESIHRAHHAENNLDVRIARIFSTYGTHAGLCEHHIIGNMIVKALCNQDITIYGSGDQIRTFCWVEDMVDGLRRLMQLHSSERFMVADLGAATTISIRELAELIISLTGSRSKVHHLAARADEPPYKIPSLQVAEDELNWSATTDLREGLQRTISYVEKELAAIAMSQMSWVEIYS